MTGEGRARRALLGLGGTVVAASGLLMAPGAGTASRPGAAVPAPAPLSAPSARTGPASEGPAVEGPAPFRPLVLVLPGGVTAPVQDAGLHPDGSLAIPDDPAAVGWWDGGALAGDAFGSVVVAGHVDSARYGLGVMAALRTLAVGQVVELRAGEARVRYLVTGRSEVPQAELAARTDAFRQDVPPRLVLITCGGAFDPVRHRYQDNLVVHATPVAPG